MSANLAPYIFPQLLDNNGDPLVGGKIHTYMAGTTTPLATFADESGTEPNANPIVLDSAGRYEMWLKDHYYKFVLTDAGDVVIKTIDRVKGKSSEVGGGAAAAVSSLAVGPFYAPQITGAVLVEEFGFESFVFSKDAEQTIKKIVTVPDNYASGPITLKAAYYSEAITNAVKFQMTATLISKYEGAAVSASMPTYTESLQKNLANADGDAEFNAVQANQLRTLAFNVCKIDQFGALIDQTYIKARDQIIVEIKRVATTDTETESDVKIIKHGAEERFT